ncbi:MAG: ester cyclase [Alphaproteobacteria bacterium]
MRLAGWTAVFLILIDATAASILPPKAWAQDAPDPARAARAPVEAFWAEVWNRGQIDAIDRLMSEDFVIHSAGRTIGPRDAFKAWVASFFDNISGLSLDVQDIMTDGRTVVTRWRCTGTLTGTMFGIEGTGQPIQFTGINIMTVEDGRITEAWVERDALGLLHRLEGGPD